MPVLSKARPFAVAGALTLALGALGAGPAFAATSTHDSAHSSLASQGLHFAPAVVKKVNGKDVSFSQIENVHGKCLDANSNHYPKDGDNVQLWTCAANARQFWYYDSSNGLIYNEDTSYCLDANSNHYPKDGDNIQLWTCAANARQEWADMPIYPTFDIIANQNLTSCIDANSAHYGSNGDNIQLWGCGSTPEQSWSSSQ